MNNNGSETSNWTNIHPELTNKEDKYNLKKELTEFYNSFKDREGICDFVDDKSPEEVKYYWDIVELCRDIKKRMESIYEKP
mgnify:FL=1|jgi:hypothetical protein